MPWPTLHPRLADPDTLEGFRAAWWADRTLRIEHALAPGLADALVAFSAQRPFELYEKQEATRFLYWRQVHRFQGDLPPVVAQLQQLLQHDIPGFVSALTGTAHGIPPLEEAQFNLLRRGSYLDPHSDHLPTRLVGFVVGLTRANWPAAHGGHLRFLWPDKRTERTSWPPGFDTLDLLGFYPTMCWHDIPVLTEAHDRLTLNGWMSAVDADGTFRAHP